MSRLERTELICLFVVLAVGLSLRVYWVASFPMEPISDFGVLFRFARAIAHGQWRTDSFLWNSHGHGFPLVLAPFLVVADRLEAALVSTTLMQLGMLAAVWWLARSLFGPRAGIVAAACAACLPGLWMMAPLVAKDNLSMFLLPLGLALAWRAGRPGRALAAGLTFALLGLTRANFLPFIPVAGLLTIFGAARGSRWRVLVGFGAGVSLLLGPVIFLNVRHGLFPLPTATAPLQIWIVHNERATGRYIVPDSDDDSPFLGIEKREEQLLAMRKLGLQFVAANPLVALSNIWMRHELHWETDNAGLDWTYNRAAPAWQARIPLSARQLRRVVDGLLVLLLLLALLGAIRGGGRPGVASHLALPLLYGFLTLTLAEANRRYHVTFTPLLCVLAGAALMPRNPRPAVAIASLRSWPVWRALPFTLVLAFGLLLVAFSRVTGIDLSYEAVIRGEWGGWLVVAIAVALVAHPVACWGPGLIQALAGAAVRQPAWATAALAALASGLLLGTLFVIGQAAAMVEAVGAVAPQGWERYQQDQTGERTGLPLQLVSAGTPGHLRQVSYPDGVRLDFDGVPQAGAVAGLRRELADLAVGETYTFYLHVFDPGSDGDPDEALSVQINDQVLWQRVPGTVEEAAWHHVVANWVADAGTAAISVERTAGANSGQADQLVPIIRTLHLYPEY